MAFNPFNLFKGNPKVLELMGKQQPIDMLLMEQPFISEFKRSENQALQNYMNYEKYQQLIRYITEINQENAGDKNKGYRFPFVSAEILAINNQMTFKYLLQEVVFTQEEIQEQIEVQREIDSESSERSYSSIKSNNSNRSRHDSRELKSFEEADKENFIIRSGDDKILADYLNEDKQISEDDFPDAKPKKTIIVKEKSTRTVKVPYQPLIFSILKYFEINPVIHILDGYISKVLENIINNRFEAFISIIQKYRKLDILKSIFSHIDSNSVQQFLLNFITKLVDCDSITPLSDEVALLRFIQSRCLQRVQFWQQSKLPIQQRAYFLYLYSLLLDKITSKIKDKVNDQSSIRIQKQLMMIDKIANDQHIGDLASILGEIINDSERKAQNSIIIKAYLKIIKNILQTFLCLKSLTVNEKISKEQLISIKKILEHCEDAFDCIINLGFSYIFEDFLLMEGQENIKYKPQNTMTSKLEFLEIIGKLVQENIYFSRTTVIDNPFFDHILKIMELYPNSSIFHNHILKIVIPFLSLGNELSIVNKFFQKKKFFSFIYDVVTKDYQSRYELKEKRRECYIGQIVSICTAVQQYDNPDSEECRNFKQTEQWQFIHECLLQDAKGVNKKLLGGLQKKNEKKPVIFFNKNECLHHFRYFLSGVKYNMFQDFQNYEPSNSDSEDEGDPTKKYLQIEDDDKVMEGSQIEDDSKYFDENIEL